MAERESNYWLDRVAEAAIKQFPTGEIIVSSGVSPSGIYHVGSFREVLTADAIRWAISERGRAARHLHFVDDFDPFRKVPVGVPAEFREHLGKPYYLVPSPDGQAKNYADYFFGNFYKSVEALGIEMTVIKSHEQYQAGKFISLIEQSLAKVDAIKRIIKEISGQDLSSDWAPIQLLSDKQRLDEWKFIDWDKSKQVIKYRSAEGSTGEVDYTKGQVKLRWRLDWPARWQIWGVKVEPFGRDHSTKGGSYDTGKQLAIKIFGGNAPMAVPYEFINPVGDTKKMSASAGTGLTPEEVLKVMPPEVLRFFVLSSPPSKTLFFDPGEGVRKLIDEFSQLQSRQPKDQDPSYRAYRAARAGKKDQVIASAPFNAVVTAYQTAGKDKNKVLEILSLLPWAPANPSEQAVLLDKELGFIDNWLAKYAPESVKFEIQPKLPAIKLSASQQDFLKALARQLEQMPKLYAQDVHNAIYKLKDDYKLEPAAAFKAIYQVILDKDYGPKAGWFLASLDKSWLIKRLKLDA